MSFPLEEWADSSLDPSLNNEGWGQAITDLHTHRKLGLTMVYITISHEDVNILY